MNIEQVKKKLYEKQEAISAIDAQRKALEETIALEKKALLSARDVVSAEYQAVAEKLVKVATYEDFLKPEVASVLYDTLWQGSVTNETLMAQLTKVWFPGTYVNGYGFYGGAERPMFSAQIAVPAKPDETTVAATAARLEPFLKVATKLDDNARISILEDSLSRYESYAITWDEFSDSFELGFHEYGTLLEALKHVPTYE